MSKDGAVGTTFILSKNGDELINITDTTRMAVVSGEWHIENLVAVAWGVTNEVAKEGIETGTKAIVIIHYEHRDPYIITGFKSVDEAKDYVRDSVKNAIIAGVSNG